MMSGASPLMCVQSIHSLSVIRLSASVSQYRRNSRRHLRANLSPACNARISDLNDFSSRRSNIYNNSNHNSKCYSNRSYSPHRRSPRRGAPVAWFCCVWQERKRTWPLPKGCQVHIPLKCPFQVGNPGPHLNTRFLGPTPVCSPNDIFIGSSVFAGLTTVTNRQTDHHATYDVCANSPRLTLAAVLAMRAEENAYTSRPTYCLTATSPMNLHRAPKFPSFTLFLSCAPYILLRHARTLVQRFKNSI